MHTSSKLLHVYGVPIVLCMITFYSTIVSCSLLLVTIMAQLEPPLSMALREVYSLSGKSYNNPMASHISLFKDK